MRGWMHFSLDQVEGELDGNWLHGHGKDVSESTVEPNCLKLLSLTKLIELRCVDLYYHE